MISVYLRGVMLDTDNQTQIGFQIDNPFFTGGDNTVPHTYEFTLPDTPGNVEKLNLDKHFEMPGLRHRDPAMLTVDDKRIAGWIYLLQWTGSRYSMLFELGRPDERLSRPLKEWWQPADTLDVDKREPVQQGGTIPAFGWYSYDNGFQQGVIYDPIPLFPTANLGGLLTSAATAAGYSISYPQDTYICADNFGLVLPTMEVYTDNAVQLSAWVPNTAAGTVTVVGGGTLASVGLSIVARRFKRGLFNSNKTVHTFTALRPVNIVFRAGNAPGVCVVGGKGYDFYSQDPRDMMVMPSAAACSFDLDTGDYFAVVSSSEWALESITNFPRNHWKANAYVLPVSCEFQVRSLDGQAVAGQTLNLADNLPDLSFIELLEAYCRMCNLYYVYDHEAGHFDVQSRDVITYANTRQMAEETVAAKGPVLRYIEGYARHNGVECRSADYVTGESRYRLGWDVDNDALEDEASVAVVPFNEGLDVVTGGSHVAKLLDVESDDNGGTTWRGVLSVIFQAPAGHDALHINTITADGGVGSVFRQVTDTASECEYRIRMPLGRFLEMRSRDTWIVRGRRCYVRTASWSGGFATMRLVEVEV